jgi:hypothetical protein
MSKNTQLGNLVNGVYVDSSGRVGVGTQSPLTNLMIGDGAVQQQPYLSLARNATGGFFAGVRWYDGTTVKSYIQEDSDYMLRFGTSNTLRAVITAAGNVGIGASTSPTYLLEASTAGGSQRIRVGTLQNNNNNSTFEAITTANNTTASAAFFRANAGGSATIGVSTYNKSGGDSGNFANLSSQANTVAIQITANGNVAMGTENTQDARLTLCYAGGVDWAVGPKSGTSSFAIIGSTGGGGGVYVANGGTSWAAWSDRRVKKNIENLNYGLSEILSISPIRFNYLTDDNDNADRIGFIAQDVQEQMPEIVNYAYEDILGMSSTDLVPVLVKAIQELKAEIEILKQK